MSFCRYIKLWLIAFCCLWVLHAKAQSPKEGPRTSKEELHIGKLIKALKLPDSTSYAQMFPSFDTMWMYVQQYRDTSVAEERKLANIRLKPQLLYRYDPQYNPEIYQDFETLIKKGNDSNIHWQDIILERYELVKMRLTRDIVGIEKIFPVRFQGFIFFKDRLTRKEYAMTINDMVLFKDKWYGGHFLNVLQARTMEEYEDALIAEKKRLRQILLDSINGVTRVDSNDDGLHESMFDDEDERKGPKLKEIVDRKLYLGWFDEDIKVKLYIRSLKGACPGAVCGWDAIFKFGDQDEWTLMKVSRTPEGKWVLSERPVNGTMELELKEDTYTGTWTAVDDQTGYEVELTEKKAVANKRLMEMDDIIDNQLYIR